MQHTEIAPAFSQPIIFPDVDAQTIAADEAAIRMSGSWNVFMRRMLAPIPFHPPRGSRLVLVENAGI